MHRDRILIDGDGITVFESGGHGHPILFVHGNSASGLTFSNQLEGDLGRRHRVVAFDLPGHGASDRPHDPAATYSLPGFGRVLRKVVDALGIHDTVIVGWSLGGHVAMEAAESLPDAAGFAVCGAPPLGNPPAMEDAFGSHPAMGAMFSAEANPVTVQSLVSAFFSSKSSVLEKELVEMWLKTDGNARALLGQSFAAGNYADELRIVEELTCPIALLQGEDERLVRRDYLESITIPTLWEGSVQVIPEAAHVPHLENPAAFNRLLEEFVSEAIAARM